MRLKRSKTDSMLGAWVGAKLLAMSLPAVLILTGALSSICHAGPRSFDDAVSRGVIDLAFNPWSARDLGPLVNATITLKPGLVNRLGFQFQGPSRYFLDQLAPVADKLRKGIPNVRLGGGFPEILGNDYHEALVCEANRQQQVFEARDLTRDPQGTSTWMDLSRPRAGDFYICIGKILIRQGFSHFHFEQGMITVRHAANVPDAIQTLKRVEAELSAYARNMGVQLSFSGDPELGRLLPLDAVYEPARFYIDTFARDYRNKIEMPEAERGYTYALSPRIVEDLTAQVTNPTRVFFYVDNFDAQQDDLRRVMELGPVARRALIQWSALTAALKGAVFLPALNHCDGCIPRSVAGDPCMVVPASNLSEYDAVSCGDIPAVSAALALQRHYYKPSK